MSGHTMSFLRSIRRSLNRRRQSKKFEGVLRKQYTLQRDIDSICRASA